MSAFEPNAEFQLLKEAVGNARMLFMDLDGAGCVKDFCHNCERVTGFAKAEVLGKNICSMLAVKEEQQLLRREINDFLAGSAAFPVGFTVRWLAKDGTTKVIAWNCTVRSASPAEQSHVICIGRDLSEPDWSTQTTAKLNFRANMILEQLPAVMWTIDRDFQITSSSGYALKGLGLETNMLRGISLFQYLHTDDQNHYSVAAHRRALNGETVNFESERLGRYFYSTIEPLVDENSTVIGAIGLAIDMTERKKAELDLEQLAQQERLARIEAERLGRIKDEFLITLSHELRTPLAPILGWVDILANDALDPDRTALALKVIERCAKTELQLIDDLLDHSRIISGKITLDIKPVEIGQIIANAFETVKLAAASKHIQINFCPLDAPVYINGDACRLRQAVWNILGNAVKFTGTGGKIDIAMRVGDGGFSLTVADNGVGMPAEFLPFVFERFRQADSSTSRRFGGLGLGLSLVKTIVESHGGTVSVVSPGEGQGATFTMFLPLRAAMLQLSRYIPLGEQNVGGSLPLEQGPSLDGVKILVVEDMLDDREVLCRLLGARKAEVCAVTSAQEALAAIGAWHPNVIISDIGLPEEDGFSLIKAVRAMDTPDRYVPAIALTAYAGEVEERKALEAGYQIHLAKPAEGRRLLEIVSQLAHASDEQRFVH